MGWRWWQELESEMPELKDLLAIATGASSGLGEATAVRLAELGRGWCATGAAPSQRASRRRDRRAGVLDQGRIRCLGGGAALGPDRHHR